MKIEIDIPKDQPKLSLDIDLDEEKVREAATKLFNLIKQKLPPMKKFPFRIKVKGGY